MATAKAIENASRSSSSPALLVVDPDDLTPGKDPDDAVRDLGAEGFARLLGTRRCAVTWRALEFARDLSGNTEVVGRRKALERAGSWLGSLPPRLALEQEDAVTAVASRCGYSPEAATRAYRARYWAEPRRSLASTLDRGL